MILLVRNISKWKAQYVDSTSVKARNNKIYQQAVKTNNISTFASIMVTPETCFGEKEKEELKKKGINKEFDIE